ncbi:MAG TPA: hypothetical protein VFA26_21475 [Gemmataceae bacterium]|nr:hypothetical protein [Gemmataceae bacterium]
MPIRFRCAYCNQLLGISRRKAGTVVRCPTCAGQVVVPATGQEEAPAPEAAGTEQPLFERSDFEEVLKGSSGDRPAAVQMPAPAAMGGFGGQRVQAAPVAAPPAAPPGASLQPGALPPVGIVLSPTKATVLTVVGILALALAFGAGVLVGRWL